MSARVTMDSPIGSNVEIRHDHGFNSSVVTSVAKAKNSKFTIRQVSQISIHLVTSLRIFLQLWGLKLMNLLYKIPAKAKSISSEHMH